ncbi:permease prefix domain 1-containing protein [Paraclostridium sordellii]|uniref:permease prefix domain 1-containing protein n=1 Tax=Paraclostridium sordellii TaxID=1505 RepID=UPI0022E847D4|nr:permease prefix domain 1-containing protein [Paeniclostridium sordellii]
MKIIDEYLNSLYANDKSQEVKDLKEELKGHLVTSTNEFIAKGYSKEDAQLEAINQFDDGAEMLKDLHKALNESKKDNERLNKRFINVFRNIFILSLIVGLATLVYEDRLVDKVEYLAYALRGELYKAGIEDRIDKPETYKKQLESILKDKEFKYIRFVKITLPSEKKPIYRYSDDSNQTKSMAMRGANIGIPDKNGRSAYIDLGIDYRPVLRVGSFYNGVFYVGVLSLITYIVLLVRYKIKFKKTLIYKKA